MCGIMGFVGGQPALPIILEGLRRLEYRGYDSAGVALLEDGGLRHRKVPGSLENLIEAIEGESLTSPIGLGHTRWATHGVPNETNAHPHVDCHADLALVHNGIIENHGPLRAELVAKGHKFLSETDTEVVVHLIEEERKNGILPAIRSALRRIRGSYAIAVISRGEPGKIYASRRDASPLVIGVGKDAGYIASDVPALLAHTRDVIYLENDDVAIIGPGEVRVETLDGEAVEREIRRVEWELEEAEKGGFPHFMLKEIHDQPVSLEETLRGRCSLATVPEVIAEMALGEETIREARRVVIVACGSAYHAGMIAAQAIEELCRIPARAEMASEFRYRKPVLDPGTLMIAISQSGETADTIAAVREARGGGGKVLAVTNVVGSSITRESDGVFYMRAGPEIGVAATKTYTAQVTSSILLAVALGVTWKAMPPDRAEAIYRDLMGIPQGIRRILEQKSKIKECASRFKNSRSYLYIGRGYNYPTASEGALKLKEISYIHAEGYSAGEMKHGPIALVEPGFPTVAIAVKGDVHEKMLSNMMEIKARGGILIGVASEGDEEKCSPADALFTIPVTSEIVSPILAIIPLQLLAYHTAVLLSEDYNVDKPRNLAKSVTVE